MADLVVGYFGAVPRFGDEVPSTDPQKDASIYGDRRTHIHGVLEI